MARIYEAIEGVLLPLGRRGENEALEVRVNIKQWIADYGNGAFGGLAQRYGDDFPYPVTITVNGDYACWLVTDVDTAIEGYGKFELDYIVGGVLAKSVMWRTKVQPSVAEPGPVPDPYESWVEEVLEAGAAALNMIPKVTGATVGNLPEFTADGALADSGMPAETDPTLSRSGVAADAAAVGNLQAEIDAQRIDVINLFNPKTITKGVYIGSSGAINSNGDYYLSALIPVEPTKKYFISTTASNPAYAYKQDKTPYSRLQPISTIAGKGCIIQPNASTYFIRVNGYVGTGAASIAVQPEKYMVVEGDTAPADYIPHRENAVIKPDYTGQIAQDLIETVNLFDYDTVTSGEYYEDGVAVEMARYFHSAAIPVTPGKTYAVSTTLSMIGCYFNAGAFVSNILKANYTQTSGVPFSVFTVPSGVDSVIVNGYLEEGNGNPSVTVRPEAYMMVEGQVVPSNYVPYSHVRNDYIRADISRYDGNILRGKTLLTFGDSMTDGRNHSAIKNSGKGYILNYAGYVADRNDMRYYNKGWSGGTIAYGSKPMMASNGNIYINLSDVVYEPDYITIFYGFNDYNQGTIQLGTIDSIDASTFYGAWNYAIQKLKAKWPNARIGVMVVWGMAQEWHDAVIDVCQKYGVAYLDTCDGQFPLIRKNGTSLLDETWATARMAETTYDGTHPNDYGYSFMSTAYEAFLRRL